MKLGYELFGCDVSTEKIAVVAFGPEGMLAEEVKSSVVGPRGGKRKDLLSLVDSFYSLLIVHSSQDATVLIEGLPWVQNRNGIVSFGQVIGALRYACHILGIKSEVVDGKVWKSGLGMKANASKEEITNWLLVDYDLPPQHRAMLEGVGTQDIIDAYCIARYGMVRGK